MRQRLSKLSFIFLCYFSIAGWCFAAPTVSFITPSSSIAESSVSINVDVVLSEPSTDTVSVDFDIVGVTAEPGSDFSGSPGTLTFSPGETTKSINFEIHDDDVNEPEETFRIVLSNPVNATLGTPSVHLFKIEDNDEVEVNFSAEESEGSESAGTVTAVVELSRPSEQTITVDYDVGGTAEASLDYDSPPGQLVFEPGTVQNTIEINIIDDDEEEQDETIEVTITSAENATIGTRSRFSYTIIDDDAFVPYVHFTTTTSSVPEDVGYARIEVSLSAPAESEASVGYFVKEDSSGKPDVDYRLTGNTVTFAPGESKKEIEIEIINDDVETADKSIILTLTNPVNAKIDAEGTTHTLWKIDDDQEPTNLSLFKQEIPAKYSLLRWLVVVGPKTMTVNPGGIAVDGYGNYYITDQGPNKGKNEGSILMWPKNFRNVIRIIKNVGLTRPGDIELSKDQRSLIVADPVGIHVFPLGLSLHVTNIDPLTGNTRVHVFSVVGEKVARVSEDGYFHFPGILVPQQGRSVKVVIEHAGITKSKTVCLGQPGMDGEPFGHTVFNIEF